MLNHRIANELRCPSCPDQALNLRVTQEEAGQIISGTLTCQSCSADYAVQAGVSDLVPAEVSASPEWQLWNDHLAGFAARRTTRLESPESFSTRITNKSSSLQGSFGDFVDVTEGALLDIGCGPGNFRKQFDSERVTYFGIDPLPLDETENFPFARAIAEFLPFRTDMFTDVVVMSAMDHFQGLDAFGDEVVRVLQPGGRLHIVQSIHEVRSPVTAIKTATHWVKDRLETRATQSQSQDAPKHMYEFDGRSIHTALDLRFEITAEKTYSKRWYSPENLFLSMTPRNNGASGSAS